MHAEMLIDGHFIGGPCDQAVGKSVIGNPFDGRIVGTAAEGSALELRTAIAAAADAFQTWRTVSPAGRSELLHRISVMVRERRGELATLLVDEIGKPISLAEGEVDRLALTFELAASLVGLGREELSLEFDPRGVGYHCSADRFPIGVVLAIVPYNWPYNLTAHKIAPALAVGNTIVVKPSPKALLSTYALGRIIHECGCPQGVVNVVDAPVLAVKAACQDSRVKMVSFTGSDTVGWELKHSLPPQTRCTLELGGDASVAVFADADQDWAVKRLVAGAFGYAGQICISIQHVWVQDSIYDEFALRLAEATRACPCGDPALRETVCGPLITAEAADRVEEWIVEAVVEGAKILAGGTREKNVIAPTLVANVPSDSKLATREVFGPVLTVGRFETAEQAIELINGSAYGLQAGVFTGDDSVAERCYRELDVGGVIINDYPTLRFDNMPYGGNKRSGFGREGVQYAMEEMSVLKARIDRG